MNRRQLVSVLFVGVVLLGTLPMPALGQSPPRPVLLAQDATPMGQVTVDGQTYEVYRHDNLLPYASGISIYADGDRITSSETARSVLGQLARQLSVDSLDPGVTTRLRASAASLNATFPAVSRANETVDEMLGYIERSKTRRVNGTTVYNASVEAAPQIPSVVGSARDLRGRLDSYRHDAREYIHHATSLADLLERRHNGTAVPRGRLYEAYTAAIHAKDDLTNHLGFSGIQAEFDDLAGASETIASRVADVPERGTVTADVFRRLHNATVTAANRFATLGITDFDLDGALERSQERRESWMEQWRSRRHAASEVYLTVGLVAGAVVATGGYVGWRRH